MATRGGSYGAYYAAQTGQPASPIAAGSGSDALQSVLSSAAVAGATLIRFKSKTGKGAAQQLVVRPATPVAPVMSYQPPAPAAPGFFQRVNADGSIGTNWTKVAMVGAGAIGVVVVVASLFGRKGR